MCYCSPGEVLRQCSAANPVIYMCRPYCSLWGVYLHIPTSNYRIAGNFRGVLIFVIFVTIPRVTKFSTHEFFHPRIFSRLLTSFAYRASGVTKFKTTKINSEDPRQLFTKICTPENYPLYGMMCTDR